MSEWVDAGDVEPTNEVQWVDAPPVWYVVDDRVKKHERVGWQVAVRSDNPLVRVPVFPPGKSLKQVKRASVRPRYRERRGGAPRPAVFQARRYPSRRPSLFEQIFRSSLIIPTVLLSSSASISSGTLSMAVTYGLAGFGLAASALVSGYYMLVMLIVSSIGITIQTGQRRILGNLLLTIALVAATLSVFMFFLLMGAVGATIWLDLQV